MNHPYVFFLKNGRASSKYARSSWLSLFTRRGFATGIAVLFGALMIGVPWAESEPIDSDTTLDILVDGTDYEIAQGVTLAVNNDTTVRVEYSSTMSGLGGFLKQGSHTLTLLGENTYTGDTTINNGILVLKGGVALDDESEVSIATIATLEIADAETISTLSGNGAVILGATLTLDENVNSAFSGSISSSNGSGGLTKEGSNTFSLAGTNTFKGDTLVNEGTLVLQGGSALDDDNDVTVADVAELHIDNSETVSSLSGGGIVVLNDNSTLTVGFSKISTDADVTFSGDIRDGTDSTVDPTTSSTGNLTKIGGHKVILSGANTFTGTTTIEDGSLELQGGSALDDVSGVFIGEDGTLTITNAETIGLLQGEGNVTLTEDLKVGRGDQDSEFFGDISGAGGLIKDGDSSTLTLSGENTYTGTTTIEDGALALRGEKALADTNVVAVESGGTLQIIDDETIGSISGEGASVGGEAASAIELGATLTTGGDDSSTEFEGSIGDLSSESGGLVKTGAGTFTLSGTNTYTGTTEIQQGTLLLKNGDALSSTTAVTVASDSTLQVDDDETIGSLEGAGDVIINDATLTTGANGESTEFSGIIADGTEGAGSLTKTGAGTFTLSGANTFSGSTTIEGGLLVVENGSALSDTDAVTVSSGTLQVDGAETIGSLDNDDTVTVNAALTIAGALDNDASSTITANAALTAGSLSGAGTITLDATLTAGSIVGEDESTTFSGTIEDGTEGAGSFIKQGAGTLTLTGSNDYSGATTVEAGTLALEGGSAIGDESAVTVNSGSFLQIDENGETIGSLAGEGTVTTDSELRVGLALEESDSTEFSGTITGGGSLTKEGAGTLILSGTGSYTDATTVEEGTLEIQSGAALADDNEVIVESDGTLAVGVDKTIGSLSGEGNVTLTGILTTGSSVGSGESTTFSGTISGDSNLVKEGEGTFILSNGSEDTANSYGTTTINAGTLETQGGFAINDTSAVSVNEEGTLLVTDSETIGSLDGSGAVTLDGSTLTTGGGSVDTQSFTGNIGGTGSLIKTGDSVFELSGENTYTGTTTIEGGTLSLQSATALPETSEIIFTEDGALEIGVDLTIDSLSGAGDVTLTGTLTTGSSASTELSGAISGAGGLIKQGAGTLALSGANSYAGSTQVTAGTLLVNGDSSAATGEIIVSDGATLGGGGSIGGNVTVNEGATLSPGNSIETITIGGDLTESGTLEIEFGDSSGTTLFDSVSVGGSVVLDSTTSILSLTAPDPPQIPDGNGGLIDISVFDPADIVDGDRFNIINSAGGISGSWSEINAFDGAAEVLFDLGTGDLVGASGTLSDASDAQQAIYQSIYNAAKDSAGNYDSNDGGAGGVLNGLLTMAESGGADAQLSALDSTSPESYAGTLDYAIHSVRSSTDVVMQGFLSSLRTGSQIHRGQNGALEPSPEVAEPDILPDGSFKDLPDDPVEKAPKVNNHKGQGLQIFAGFQDLNMESDSSDNNKDYKLGDFVSYIGFSNYFSEGNENLYYGGFITINRGSVDSSDLDLNVDGHTLGAFAYYLASDEVLGLWANLSHGFFEYGGNRSVLGVSQNVKDFDGESTQLGIGGDYLVHDKGGITVRPGAGLRFITGSVDDINEGGIFSIDGLKDNDVLFDLLVRASYIPAGKFGLNAYLGYQQNLTGSERDVDYSVSGNSTSFTAEANGLGTSSINFGFGGYYDITEHMRLSFNYRGESRSDAKGIRALDFRFVYIL